MAVQNLDAAFAAIIKDCQAVAVEAVRNAAKKAQGDVVKEAYRYLAKYYANYRPKRYKRTKNLHKSITPVFEDRSTGDKISIEVGVEYDSNKLKGFYRSNSRYHQAGTEWISRNDSNFDWNGSNNGSPEPWWVMDNFLEGVHPGAQVDNESTDSLMREFLDKQLPGRIGQYVQEELFDSIINRLSL